MTGKDKTRLVLIAAALAAVVLLARFAYPRLSASFRESEPAARFKHCRLEGRF